jgi:hypothetical protein
MIRKLGIFFFILFVCCSTCYPADIDDGFSSAKNIKSDYFTIYIQEGIDLQEIQRRLSIPLSLRKLIRTPLKEEAEVYNVSGEIDTLFLLVSEMLDIHLYRLNSSVKICRNSSELSKIAIKLFNQEVKSHGFYVLALDTIYIDAENIDICVLGHELAHLIQCNYFIVLPPVKIQEVLSMFVEYQLRKYISGD